MSSENRSGDDGRGGGKLPKQRRRPRGRRAATVETPHDNPSFEDYATEKLWSFLCAQMTTALTAYVALVLGDAWLGQSGMSGPAALWSAAPAMPMGVAITVAWSKRGGARASFAALAFIAALEAGIVLHAWQRDAGPALTLPAFVLIPLTFSPVLLLRWDFAVAAVLSAAGPLALIVLDPPSSAERFGLTLSVLVAISTSLVTNLFALRSQQKSYRLERQLRAFADIDELTQLPRRRRVFELGRRILHRADRQGQPVSVLYVDADHFKALNDRFGHDAGDRALRALARQIQESLRPSDVCGRFGGEEFVALLPGADREDAVRAAERLRKRVEEMRQLETPLTVSVGVAQRVPGEHIDRVIRRADSALLAAKDRGRNRVEIAPPPEIETDAKVGTAATQFSACPPAAVRETTSTSVRSSLAMPSGFGLSGACVRAARPREWAAD